MQQTELNLLLVSLVKLMRQLYHVSGWKKTASPLTQSLALHTDNKAFLPLEQHHHPLLPPKTILGGK